MNRFVDFDLLPKIQKSLELLGFTTPTEIQAKVVPHLLENPTTDVHAQAQTGTGKTLAFGLPLLQNIDKDIKAVQGLIIAPTRELVLQTYESLKEVSRETGIVIEPIYGGMPINRQITSIKRGAHIIVGTPGRLNDHLRRKTLSLKSLKTLILDEADIMLDMGFREEIDAILESAPKNRSIWLFSATVLPGINQLIKSHMKDLFRVRAEDKKGVVSSQVQQYFCLIPKRNRIEATARFIEVAPDFYGIIFCQTKLLTSEVMEQLASRGFRVNCLHGDMKQALRNQVIKGFKNKDFNILVATDVAARGIDVSDLTHVINFSIPEEHENYIHRIGRTGRAGKQGIAIVFVAPSERYRLKRLEKAAGTTLQEVMLPGIDAIISAKMGAVSDFIEQAKQVKDSSSPVHTAISKLIDSFTESEIRHGFVAAIQDKFFKDIIHQDITSTFDFDKESTAGMPKEICIDLGTDTGLDEDMVKDYLYRVCKLAPQEVRKVRVLNKKTFISLPENRLSDCLALLRSELISTKKYKAYLVEDTYRDRRTTGSRSRSSRSDSSSRSSSGGGRFGHGNRGKRRK